MPIAEDVNIEKFCGKLIGLSGAEIAFIAREGAYNCLRRNIDLKRFFTNGEKPAYDYNTFVICEYDFNKALASLREKNNEL